MFPTRYPTNERSCLCFQSNYFGNFGLFFFFIIAIGLNILALQAKDASTYESQSVASLVSMSSFTRVGRSNSLPTGSPVVGKAAETSDSNRNSINPSSTASITNVASPLQSSAGSGSDCSSDLAPNLRLISDKVLVKLKTQFDMFISTQPEGDINTKGISRYYSYTPSSVLLTTTSCRLANVGLGDQRALATPVYYNRYYSG